MDERLQFIQDALSDRFTMSELYARYGISRRIGYKWLERYAEEGKRGLRDRSRAPHHKLLTHDTRNGASSGCRILQHKMRDLPKGGRGPAPDL